MLIAPKAVVLCPKLGAPCMPLVYSAGRSSFRQCGALRQRPALGSSIALAFTGLAVLARWLIADTALGPAPFVTFYPAVLFATLLGGLGPGVMACSPCPAGVPPCFHSTSSPPANSNQLLGNAWPSPTGVHPETSPATNGIMLGMAYSRRGATGTRHECIGEK